MKIDFKKLIPILLVHLFEIIVLYFVVVWILSKGPANYSWPAVIIMVVFYVFYFAVSLTQDIRQYTGKADFDYYN